VNVDHLNSGQGDPIYPLATPSDQRPNKNSFLNDPFDDSENSIQYEQKQNDGLGPFA
jgi:hypothetical protein